LIRQSISYFKIMLESNSLLKPIPMNNTNQHSAEESFSRNVAVMGRKLGETYSELWQQLNRLYIKWEQYEEAFGTNPERIKIFNETAPQFFYTVQNALWESILLNIFRLADKPETAGKSNLTFSRLCKLITNEPLRDEVNSAFIVVQEEAKFAQDWRNRRIAHNDLHLTLGQATKPLAPASRARIEAALSAMAMLMNLVEQHFFNSTTMYAFSAKSIPGGAYSALRYLRAGLESEIKQRERLRAGIFEPGDHFLRPL
jgi:AbiU2